MTNYKCTGILCLFLLSQHVYAKHLNDCTNRLDIKENYFKGAKIYLLNKVTKNPKSGWFRIQNTGTTPIIIPVQDDMVSIHGEHQFVSTWKLNSTMQEKGWTVIPYEIIWGHTGRGDFDKKISIMPGESFDLLAPTPERLKGYIYRLEIEPDNIGKILLSEPYCFD